MTGKWQDIETAPKDVRDLILARYGYVWDTGDAEFGSELWRKRALGEAEDSKRVYQLWWLTKGHWSSKWKNWNDGIEPSGLASPTHFMPLPDPPQHTGKG